MDINLLSGTTDQEDLEVGLGVTGRNGGPGLGSDEGRVSQTRPSGNFKLDMNGVRR